mgnify:CR=1 FL=1
MRGMPPAPDRLSAPPPGATRHAAVAPAFEETIGERDLAQWRSHLGQRLVASADRATAVLDARWPRWSLAVTLVLIVVVGGGLAIGVAHTAAEVYEQVVAHSGLAALDEPLLTWAVTTRTPRRDAAVTAFTDVGGPVGGAILAVAVLAVLLLWWRRWTPLWVLAPALLGAVVLTGVGKDLTGRARPPRSLAVPPYEVSASFPSGHTLNATVLAGLTAYLILIVARRAWVGALGLAVSATYAVAMGLSRVWLGHHWLTDVIAGWLLGLAWVLGVVTLHRLVLTLRRARAAPRSPRGAA